MRNLHLVHDGETCRCCINVDGILGNSEISLAISSEYISIHNAVTCICSTFINFVIYTFMQKTVVNEITTKSNVTAILKNTKTKSEYNINDKTSLN